MLAPILQFLKLIFFGLVPPPHPEDWSNQEQLMKWRKAKIRWRLFVAGALWIGGVLFLFLVPPLYGLLPAEYDHVAWSEDVKEVVKQEVDPLKADVAAVKEETKEIKQKLDDQDEANLLQAILAAKKEQCAAEREGRSAEYWDSELAKLRARYEKITGRRDSVPTNCGKF